MFLGENLERHYATEMPRSGRSTYGWSAYNIGSFTSASDKPVSEYSNIKSVAQVIDTIQSVLKTELVPVTIPKAENFIEIPDQFLDSRKLHDFGFTPEIGFPEGIERTVEWYRTHRELLSKLGARYVLAD
jgi:CDP-glucose 4,6-dehydratase